MKTYPDFRTSTAKAIPVYKPGEQPTEAGWIKLNTNESPFEPSDAVRKILENFSHNPDILRKYPHPYGEPLRTAVAQKWGLKLENVIVTNGSDEALTLICRAFLEKGRYAAFPSVTYSLYKTLVLASGGGYYETPAMVREGVPFCVNLEALSQEKANLIFLPNPNALTGELVNLQLLAGTIMKSNALWIIDEAYNDFTEKGNASFIPFLRDVANAVVLRTFSKTHSLAGLRIGYAISENPHIMNGMFAFKDSYNEDVIAAHAGYAALSDTAHFNKIVEYTRKARHTLRTTLESLGFFTVPSEANYILCKPPASIHADTLYNRLKENKILVRHYPASEIADFLRISIGSPREMETLTVTLKDILG